MALGFNRKKAQDSPDAELASANAVPNAPAPRADEVDNFDLDAFAAPATDATASPSESTSAFDFPEAAPVSPVNVTVENELLDFDQLFEIEQRNAAATKNQASALNQSPAPFVPQSATIGEPAAPFYAPQIPLDSPAPKKKLPLAPVLGTLALFAIAGGAASYFSSQSAPVEDEIAPVSNSISSAPTQNAATQNAATQNVAPTIAVPTSIPQPPLSGAVRPGIAPASSQLAQMKALWKRGAAAKQRGDYTGARRYWNQGLKIQPNNIGFQESIAKLPR